MTVGTHVLFQVGAEAFALLVNAVTEVLPLAELSTPPGLPEAVAGFLDFGGAIVAVLRADRLLDLESRDHGLDAHILLLRSEGPGLALLVDRVTSVRSVPLGDQRPVGDDQTFRGCVVGEIVGSGRPAHVLSAERLISEGERRKIVTFGDAEIRRRSLLETLE